MSSRDTRSGALFRQAVQNCIARDLLMAKPEKYSALNEADQVFRWIRSGAPVALLEPELRYIERRRRATGKQTPTLRNAQYREFVRMWRRLCPLTITKREMVSILAEETRYKVRTIERAISAI